MNFVDERSRAAFAAAMTAERGRTTLQVAAAIAPVRAGDVDLGNAETGGAVGLSLAKLMEGRLLVQGVSGAGKSWTLRRLLEQSAGLVQQIVIDPEGEFSSLAGTVNATIIDAASLDIHTLRTAAGRVREHRLSVLLDLSGLEREAQLAGCAAFLRGLLDVATEHWHPALVVIDEAHILAPSVTGSTVPYALRKESTTTIVDLMSRGRKRGLCGILATQRLTRMATSAASEALNHLVGNNVLEVDVRRAAEMIGWTTRTASDRLPMLTAGDFVAVGPAFSRSPCILRVGAVVSEHRGTTPVIAAPAARSPEEAAALLDIDTLAATTTADARLRGEARLPPGIRTVREFLRDPSCRLAVLIKKELDALRPAGARVSEIAEEIGVSREEVDRALVLLDSFAVIEFDGPGAARSVRIADDFPC